MLCETLGYFLCCSTCSNHRVLKHIFMLGISCNLMSFRSRSFCCRCCDCFVMLQDCKWRSDGRSLVTSSDPDRVDRIQRDYLLSWNVVGIWVSQQHNVCRRAQQPRLLLISEFQVGMWVCIEFRLTPVARVIKKAATVECDNGKVTFCNCYFWVSLKKTPDLLDRQGGVKEFVPRC